MIKREPGVNPGLTGNCK